MTDTIHVPAHERGTIRVFSLSMSDEEARKLKKDPARQKAALGADIDTGFVEVFPLTDLTGLGLAGYLMEGNAVPEEQIAADRAKLDKLDKLGGWVLIVFSRAFNMAETDLAPTPELTLIGTYGEVMTDWRETQIVSAESARPSSAPPETVRKKPSDAAMSGRIASFALIVMFALTALIIWIAG